MLSSAQKKFLKGQAHHHEPLVIIGKSGVQQSVQRELRALLEARELVKVKFNDFKSQRHELAAELASELEAELVQVIGNIAVFYKPSSKTENRKIKLPGKKQPS